MTTSPSLASAAYADTLLAGKVAIVTGGARGIGRAIALDLARAGADVGVGLLHPDRDGGVLEEIRAMGRRAIGVAMDVTDLDQSRTAIDTVISELGGLDILVNNAGGAGFLEDAIDITEEQFDSVWDRNGRSTFFLSQHAARHFRTVGGGAIVNVASQAGLVALPRESAYCTAKAGVLHLTRCLAVEWGGMGIRVNAVAPTFIETPGTEPALSDPAFRADTIERIAALHRLGRPEEVSSAVVYLASPAASLITGATLAIDGGWTAR
jgi:2-deoxy-D-gluconate 3-dehydrogenase